MKKWVINEEHHNNTTYDLIAVSNHFGGMGGGHCKCLEVLLILRKCKVRLNVQCDRVSDTAYAKNRDGHWYNFDDSSVSETENPVVSTSTFGKQTHDNSFTMTISFTYRRRQGTCSCTSVEERLPRRKW